MSSSSPGSSGLASWSYAAAGVLVGVGAGYALGVASSSWLAARSADRGGDSVPRAGRPGRHAAAAAQALDATASGNVVAAIVELTAEVSRLRQAVESGLISPRLPLSARSARGGSTADFVSARGDNTESEEEFFDPNEQGGGDEGVGVTMATPDYDQLDDLGRRALESQDTCETLIEQIRTALTEFPDDVGLLWRLARSLFHLGNHLERDGDGEGQRSLIEEALEYTQQALELTDDVWQVHQWYAIAVGSLSKHEGTQRKIEMGYKYKEHINRAITLKPEEKTLHHLRGRFCYEVAGVSWLEKRAAAALFGSPPESSYEEALESLMKAEEQTTEEWKTNALYIAKCHLQLSDIPSAVEWLHKAYNMPTNTPEDHSAHDEVKKLLSQNDPTFTEED